MTKAELIENLFHNCLDLQSKAATTRVVEAALDLIRAELSEGDGVSLAGFGHFKVAYRKPRTGRNPHTGEEIEIAGKNVVRFKPSSKLATAVA